MSDRVPEGFVEVNFHFTLAGDPETMISSIGLEMAEEPVIEDVLGTIVNVRESLALIISDNYTLGPDEVEIGTAEPENPTTFVLGTFAGQVNADAAPQNCCYLFSKYTATAGRRGRGRMFIPGVPGSYVQSTGSLDPTAYATDITTVAQSITDLFEAEPSIVGCSLFHATAPFTPSHVVGVVAAGRIATQRHRMRP